MGESLPLGDSEKLIALRAIDQYRRWGSLDEKRRCLQCGQVITGRQIRIVVAGEGAGSLEGRCPTEHCSSIPMDWALPTVFLVPSAPAGDGFASMPPSGF